jgi:acyl-coenzyme A synthetase/AMP-(fatty) acid ligase
VQLFFCWAIYIFADFAAAKTGLVKVPLDVMVSSKDIEYRIKDSEAKAVLLDEFFHPTLI